jgi:hypothetical protein
MSQDAVSNRLALRQLIRLYYLAVLACVAMHNILIFISLRCILKLPNDILKVLIMIIILIAESYVQAFKDLQDGLHELN